MSIAENLKKIQAEITQAKARSDKAADEITLVCVSKKHTVMEIEQVLAGGQFILGENRVQELCEKYPNVSAAAKWHLIGHLQKNKVKYIIDKVQLIHSLDSVDLAEEINKRAQQIDKVMDCLVQVNIAKEESKYGLAEEEIIAFLQKMGDYPYVQIRGLMNIAPNYEDKEMVRQDFKRMNELFLKLKAMNLPKIQMDYLSMGMSGDFVIAVEEGANMLRIGSKIFAENKNGVV